MTAWFTRNLAWIIGAALLAFIVIAFGSALLSGSRAKVEAKLNANRADAAIATGQDAANTVADVGASASAIDRTTMENDREIRNAPGAKATVDPDLHRAGVVGLCRYPAYRSSPQCLPYTVAK
jgi:hypothetical protein